MKWLADKLKVLQCWWKADPGWKWAVVGTAIVLLLIAATKAEGQEQGGTFYIGNPDRLVIQCNRTLNADGIHVCAATHSGQRGYCIPISENRFPNDSSAYWCTGNKSGNKTYDKALLIKETIDDSSKTMADVNKVAADWDLTYPPGG